MHDLISNPSDVTAYVTGHASGTDLKCSRTLMNWRMGNGCRGTGKANITSCQVINTLMSSRCRFGSSECGVVLPDQLDGQSEACLTGIFFPPAQESQLVPWVPLLAHLPRSPSSG